MSFKRKLKDEFDKQILIGDSSKVKEEFQFEDRRKPIFKRGLSLGFASIALAAGVIVTIFAVNGINTKSGLSKSYIDSQLDYRVYSKYKNSISNNKDYINTLKTNCTNVVLDSSTINDIKNTGISTEEVEGYNSDYSIVETGYITYDMPIWGTDSNLIYPGSLIRVDNPENNKELTSFGLRTGDVVLSTSHYTSTGINGSITRTVKNATASNTRDAISSILKDVYVDGSTHACNTYFSTHEIKNVSELNMALGTVNGATSNEYKDFVTSVSSRINEYEMSIGATKFNDFGDVIETKSVESSETRSFTMVEFTQSFYDVTLDAVMSPSDIISSKNSEKALSYAFLQDGICSYVSNITYGRKAIFVFESTDTYENFIKVSGDSNSKLDSLSNKSSIVNSYSMVVGMDLETSNKLSGANSVAEIKNILFNSAYTPSSYVSKPISYQLRYIDGTNSLVGCGNIKSHYLKTMTKI